MRGNLDFDIRVFLIKRAAPPRISHPELLGAAFLL
jgi:hypothetical protein